MFEENERLVILRLSKSYAAEPAAAQQSADWRAWVGRLKDSPAWSGDPLAEQQDMRREWD